MNDINPWPPLSGDRKGRLIRISGKRDREFDQAVKTVLTEERAHYGLTVKYMGIDHFLELLVRGNTAYATSVRRRIDVEYKRLKKELKARQRAQRAKVWDVFGQEVHGNINNQEGDDGGELR